MSAPVEIDEPSLNGIAWNIKYCPLTFILTGRRISAINGSTSAFKHLRYHWLSARNHENPKV